MIFLPTASQCIYPRRACDLPHHNRRTYHALLGGLEVLLGLGQLSLVGLLIRLLGLDNGGVLLGSGLCGARRADLGSGGSSEVGHVEIV